MGDCTLFLSFVHYHYKKICTNMNVYPSTFKCHIVLFDPLKWNICNCCCCFRVFRVPTDRPFSQIGENETIYYYLFYLVCFCFFFLTRDEKKLKLVCDCVCGVVWCGFFFVVSYGEVCVYGICFIFRRFMTHFFSYFELICRHGCGILSFTFLLLFCSFVGAFRLSRLIW